MSAARGVLLGLAFLCLMAHAYAQPARVVYDVDNRLDEFEAPESARVYGSSTAVLVRDDAISFDGSRYKLVVTRTLAKRGICSDQQFAQQPTVGYCSGFLISANQIATAGHCIWSTTRCQSTYFVFGYVMVNETTPNLSFEPAQVYRCQNFTSVWAGNLDFAVVTLDRPVEKITPLSVSHKKAEIRDEVYMVGHPTVLPRKYAAGASVTKDFTSGTHFQWHFLADVDAFGGNSGSAVFFSKTNEIAGILVRGAVDYVYDELRECSVVNVCPNIGAREDCTGEDVTYSDILVPFIPNHCVSDTECSGNGSCNIDTNICNCLEGYFGTDCSVKGGREPCSGRGVMADLWKCSCDDGYYGDLCEMGSGPLLDAQVIEPVVNSSSIKFGNSVSIWEDVVAIGQPKCLSPNHCDGGVVNFYKITSAGMKPMNHTIRLKEPRDAMCGHNILLRGDRILVSCLQLPVNYPLVGAVHLLGLNPSDGTWNWISRMAPVANENPVSSFGAALATFNKIIYVGAPSGITASKGKTGVVYLYHVQGQTWNKKPTRISPHNGAEGDNFGIELAAYEYMFAVSNRPQTTFSKVYLYTIVTNGYRFLLELSMEGYFYFGSSIALTKTSLLIGNPEEPSEWGLNSGSIHVYDISRSRASLFQTIQAPSPAQDMGFGYRLAESNGHLAVVNYQSLHDITTDGGLLIYALDSETGTYNFVVAGSNDLLSAESGFGKSIAISSGGAVVGAPFDAPVGKAVFYAF